MPITGTQLRSFLKDGKLLVGCVMRNVRLIDCRPRYSQGRKSEKQCASSARSSWSSAFRSPGTSDDGAYHRRDDFRPGNDRHTANPDTWNDNGAHRGIHRLSAHGAPEGGRKKGAVCD